MSGHSKWATTKRHKAVIDSKRAGVFTKIANLISIAAREKGGDPEINFSLRLAIEKGRAVNMPKENIERAIKRGTGEGGTQNLEEILYEGFGLGGGSIIIETVTDNRNRTFSEVRHILSKYGGTIGAQNSCLWKFEKRGTLTLSLPTLSEEQELALIEAGVDDYYHQDDYIILVAKPELLQVIKSKVEQLSLPCDSAQILYEPKTTVSVSQQDQETLEKLFDELENHNDVLNYYSNYA